MNIPWGKGFRRVHKGADRGYTVTRDAPDGPIHLFFSLSYANFLVLPRTLLQSMPLEWQERFVECMNEYDRHWWGCDLEPENGYRVYEVGRAGRMRRISIDHYERGRTMFTPDEPT